jgi:transcriptional regulator with XRE-family HTH domain
MPRRTVVAHPDFGRKLKELREQHGLSLRRLGGMIHCSHGHLWDLESGIKRPSLSVAVLLDQALEAGGQLSAMVSEVSADTDARPVAPEHAVVAMPSGLEFAPDWRHGIEVAVDLWRGDMQRRNLLRQVGFSATAFLPAAMRWLMSSLDERPAGNGERLIGAADVETVRRMTGTYRTLDNQFGGGHIRDSLVRFSTPMSPS